MQKMADTKGSSSFSLAKEIKFSQFCAFLDSLTRTAARKKDAKLKKINTFFQVSLHFFLLDGKRSAFVAFPPCPLCPLLISVIFLDIFVIGILGMAG